MKSRSREHRTSCWLLALPVVLVTLQADAQQLWKYIDKDGKVSYSDKPPKPGEKAEAIKHDPKANVIESRKVAPQAASEATGTRESGKSGVTVDQRIAARKAALDAAMKRVEEAREALESARQSLEEGREPLPEETIVIVGRTKTGASAGVNSVQRKPEYYKRIADLENAVKVAEKKLEEAETEYGKVK
ncbi:MAG: DUF4124 domain-containing protein [Betaproteobacteria bacterium]|nr:DUF4124 domain-containing protein [Betaproteobacteria bacterium]